MAAKKKTSSKTKSTTKSKNKSSAKKVVKKKTVTKKPAAKKAAGGKKTSTKTASKKQFTAKAASQKRAKTASQTKSPRSSGLQKKSNNKIVKTTKATTATPSVLSVLPTGDHVFVEVLSEERRTPGGLIIPDTVGEMEGYLEGKVLAVGPGKLNKKGHRRPLSVERGEKVMFPRWAGQSIEQSGRRYVILREDDLLGVKAD